MRQEKTVLIVEDELETAEMLEEMLHLCGYRVIRSHGGASSMQVITHELPDVMLLDLMMPDLSGLEILRFIRRDPQLFHIPVIIVTARGSAADMKTGLDAGAAAYLIKPVSFKDLRKVMDKISSNLRVDRF